MVAEAVVDALEVVQVDEEDGHGAAPTPGSSQGRGEPVEQQPAVGQPGEGVVQRLVPQTLRSQPLGGDVGEGHQRARGAVDLHGGAGQAAPPVDEVGGHQPAVVVPRAVVTAVGALGHRHEQGVERGAEQVGAGSAQQRAEGVVHLDETILEVADRLSHRGSVEHHPESALAGSESPGDLDLLVHVAQHDEHTADALAMAVEDDAAHVVPRPGVAVAEPHGHRAHLVVDEQGEPLAPCGEGVVVVGVHVQRPGHRGALPGLVDDAVVGHVDDQHGVGSGGQHRVEILQLGAQRALRLVLGGDVGADREEHGAPGHRGDHPVGADVAGAAVAAQAPVGQGRPALHARVHCRQAVGAQPSPFVGDDLAVLGMHRVQTVLAQAHASPTGAAVHAVGAVAPGDRVGGQVPPHDSHSHGVEQLPQGGVVCDEAAQRVGCHSGVVLVGHVIPLGDRDCRSRLHPRAPPRVDGPRVRSRVRGPRAGMGLADVDHAGAGRDQREEPRELRVGLVHDIAESGGRPHRRAQRGVGAAAPVAVELVGHDGRVPSPGGLGLVRGTAPPAAARPRPFASSVPRVHHSPQPVSPDRRRPPADDPGRRHSARSVTSATVAPRAATAASASTVTATPWAPAPRLTRRPATVASATTGQAVVDPNGVIVPRS
jgi:hypothetical protein